MMLDRPRPSLPALWATHARFQPDRPAVVTGAGTLSWGEFGAGMGRVAALLARRGIGRGAVVALVMDNRAETLVVMAGVVAAGAAFAPLSSLLTVAALTGMVENSAAVAVIATDTNRALVEPLRQLCPGVGHWFALGFAAEGWESLEGLLASVAPDEAPALAIDPDQPYNIIYSSGTTGLPKGILQSHAARLHFAWSNAIEMCFSRDARVLTTTALYSNGTQLMVLPALLAGATIHVMERFDPRVFLETVERAGITHSLMVPTQFITTLALPGHERHDTSRLRVLLTAGSPMRPDTRQAVRDRFGPVLHELYGFTEGFATLIRPEDVARKPGSVGTPVMGFEIAILGPDDRALPRGETGEIVGYGAGMLLEYYRNPEKTAELVWRDAQGRTWIRTGDIGRLDEDGFLTILDRKKDMIISGGFNVFPVDIEEVVGRHPAVSDVTVIGIPHEKWGEQPLALVIPHAGASANAADILAWANERLAKHQRLVEVRLATEFPRNALGKVLKRALREQLGLGGPV